MADAAPVLIWETDSTGVVSVNGHYLDFFGVPNDDVIGMGWAKFLHPEDVKRYVDVYSAAFQKRQAFSYECRFLRKDGQWRWLRNSGGPVGSDRFVGCSFDMTDIQEAHRVLEVEEELRESEARYRTLFETIDEGFCVVEFFDGPYGPLSDYVHIEANPAYIRHAGISNIVGKTGREGLTPSEADMWVATFRHVLETGEPIRFERELQSTGRYLEVSAFRIGSIDKRRVAIVFQDISPRKRAEQQLRHLNDTLESQVAERTVQLALAQDALRQSQKMEAVGQLTGGLAHDFNNLLTGVTGALDLLKIRIAQGRVNDIDRYVNIAQGAARRAAALTHRLLAFSRRQTLDPKPTDVVRLVKGMEEMIQRTVGPAIEVDSLSGTAEIWDTLIDAGQLENALLNLCINARDAMPDGGKIMIETANIHVSQDTASAYDMEPGDYVSICVMDTGTGMKPEIVAKAFEPFFTTKPTGMGTGLGLSMIYGFARQSGGQAQISSEIGKGTAVRLYLPRCLDKAEEEGAPAKIADAPRADSAQTVLVVDDEPSIRMLVKEVLEDLGYSTIEASDGPAALKIMQSNIPIDLLISDVGLPGGLNGRQVADAARVARPDLKVLFITGYAETAALGHVHLDDGMHVMTKPFAMESLAKRIKDLLSNR
jgi:PAS domain S-box-containing protein